MIEIPNSQIDCPNWIAGKRSSGSGEKISVISPYTGEAVGFVRAANEAELNSAVLAAAEAQMDWRRSTQKERAEVLLRTRQELIAALPEIAQRVSLESGKLLAEAEAGVRKGIEVLQFAISLENLDRGGRMEVSRGVFCEQRRDPLGVVAGITPFNFPAMVPMWMIPIAIALGNSFIWKPSEKTPLTSILLAEAFARAGLPPGVLSIVHGGRSLAEKICDHPGISAVGFVGSSPAAKAVYSRAAQAGKRALALGGAKNHIVLMPDADPEISAQGILASFTGCAGQRCMAASTLLLVRGSEHILDEVVKRAKEMSLGKDMGALISKESLNRLEAAIRAAEKLGFQIRLDGSREESKKGLPAEFLKGNWLGPTIIDQAKPDSEVACEELFGPILSVVRCENLSEAMAIENKNPYGNACAVFTQNGAIAEEVVRRSSVGMVGVNVGVPVPREPFSFGGIGLSKFGAGDMTGESALNFWADLRKVTVKWQVSGEQNWMS